MATKAPFPFEKSKKDVEPKGMKEGSKKEEALDRMQAKKPATAPAKKSPIGFSQPAPMSGIGKGAAPGMPNAAPGIGAGSPVAPGFKRGGMIGKK